MHVLGSNELIEDVFNRDLCIGCGACVNLCPYYKSHRGKTARLFPCDLSRGRCYAYGIYPMTAALWETTGKFWPPEPAQRCRKARIRPAVPCLP